jgi:iron uptake system component EfeO
MLRLRQRAGCAVPTAGRPATAAPAAMRRVLAAPAFARRVLAAPAAARCVPAAPAGMRRSPTAVRRVLGGVTAAGLLAAVAACTGSPPPTDTTVEVTRGGCGTGWAAPHGGDQTIDVRNVGTVTMEVELVDPATHGVYAEVESLGPGTVRPIRIVLGRGSYAFACFPEDSDAETGPVVTVKDGPARGATAVAAVSENDLADAVQDYRAHVSAGLTALATAVTGLRTAVRSGDRARAQAAWLTAQMAYGRLGAAYDTFGDAADAIDGLPAGLPGGVHDKDFAGLRRIEYGLWHGEAMPSIAKVAGRLATDVAGLRKDFAAERTDPNDLPLRAHEILENSLQFELTGASDQGSGDGLAVISANLDGTRMVLDAIAPVLKPRYPGWQSAMDQLASMTKLVDAQNRRGRWTAPEALARADRERLDGALSQLLETLAPIAAVGEVRRTS